MTDSKEKYGSEIVKTSTTRGANPVKLTFSNLEFEVDIVLNKHDARERGVRQIKQ